MSNSPGTEALLTKTPLFHGLPLGDLRVILQASHTRRVADSGFFFEQEQPASFLYVLVEGQVRVSQLNADGQQVLLRFVTPGQMFGGVALLGEEQYPASAQAAQDSAALAWEGERIAAFVVQYPRLAVNALQMMANRIKDLQDRYRELATERVERRVARTLLRLARQSGIKTDEGVLIDLPLSRQSLAEMTGTTLYSVSRFLSSWEQKGIVDSGRERILLRAPHRLVAIAEDLTIPPAHP